MHYSIVLIKWITLEIFMIGLKRKKILNFEDFVKIHIIRIQN